jgi:hypothetical protein
VQGHVRRLEAHVPDRRQETPDQQLLRDDAAGAAAGQRRYVEEVRRAVVAQLQQRLPGRPGQDLAGQTGLLEDAGRVVVEHAGALALLHV